MIMDLIKDRKAQSWATAITYGFLISRMSDYGHWEWWALLALWFIGERTSYHLGVEYGICVGATLPNKQRDQIKKIIEDEDSE